MEDRHPYKWYCYLLDERKIIQKGDIYDDEVIYSPSKLPTKGRRLFILTSQDVLKDWPEASVFLEDGEKLHYHVTYQVTFPENKKDAISVSIGIEGESLTILIPMNEVHISKKPIENFEEVSLEAMRIRIEHARNNQGIV